MSLILRAEFLHRTLLWTLSLWKVDSNFLDVSVSPNSFCSSRQREGVRQGAINADICNNRNGHAFKGAFENSLLTI